MLLPFAFVLAPAPLRDDPVAIAQNLLRGSGYALVLSDGRRGTLAGHGRRARVRVLGAGYDAATRLGPRVAVLQLAQEFGVAREQPMGATRPLGPDVLPPGKIVFVPSLGRTVAAHADLALDGETTPAGTKAALDRFFAGVDAYARTHGGRPDATPGPLGDRLTLSRPDATSLERLLRSWGYDARPPGYEWPRGGLNLETEVAGVAVSLLDFPGPQGLADRAFRLSAEGRLAKGTDAQAWSKAHSSRTAHREAVLFSPGVVLVTEKIPLPLSAGRLRRRLVAFARYAQNALKEGR